MTPFAQVVEASNAQSAGYSAQQAAADYHSHADKIVVRFHIEFTPSYGYIESDRDRADLAAEKGISLRSEDFWQAFNTGLSQNDQWIEPLSRQRPNDRRAYLGYVRRARRLFRRSHRGNLYSRRSTRHVNV
jgi:hypothetical protein